MDLEINKTIKQNQFVEYDILASESMSGLINQVNYKLANNWVPLGGVAVEDSLFCQSIAILRTI